MKKLLIISLAVIIVVISILFILNHYFNRPDICWVDFIKLDDTTYTADYYSAIEGRILTKNDLEEQYSIIKFNVSDNIFRSNYKSKNGDAAYLSKGTPIYTVKGYSPNFRLAAYYDNKIVIYEADRSPKAKKGGDLLDIEGKVKYIGINSEEDGVTELFSIKDKKTVDNMVGMVLNAPIKSVKDLNFNRYFIAFHLNDGTKVTRCYFVEPNYLQGGLQLPDEFKETLDKNIR